MGFAASRGNATRQLAAVRGVGPRRVSSWRRRHRRDPVVSRRRGGPRCAAGAARPSAPRANQPDRPSLPMTRRQAALATMGLRVCHGRSQPRQALRKSAGRRVTRRAPCSRPPHSHRDRRRDADKSARGQPRHAATSPTARSISAHFHWRKSVPHPVTEYESFRASMRPRGIPRGKLPEPLHHRRLDPAHASMRPRGIPRGKHILAPSAAGVVTRASMRPRGIPRGKQICINGLY